MASAAGAAVMAARRRVIEHFMAANAVSPKTAVGFEPHSFVQRRIFDSFVKTDVLRAADGGWYVDLPTYIREKKQRKVRAAKMVGTAALIGAAVAAFSILG